MDRIRKNGAYGQQYLQKGKNLTPHLTMNGYFQIRPRKNNIYKNLYIHRLVAQAFIPNPSQKLEVNHKDGNTQNNNVDNLEWVTRSENMEYAYKTGLQKPSQKQKEIAKKMCIKTKSKQVAQYDTNMNLIKIWNSMTEASKKSNTYVSCITECCKGRNHTAGGYIWRYVNE